MSSHALPRLQILGTALLFSTGGMAIKSCDLTSWQIVCFRCGIAAVALWVLLPRARRRVTGKTLVVAVAYAMTTILYVLANKNTTAANAIFLQSAAPFYILLLGPWLLSERIRRREALLMVVVAVGLGLFFVGQEPASATAPDPARGNLYAGAAGLTWALTVMGLRWLDRSGGHSATGVIAGNFLACLVSLPLALPVLESRPTDWLWVAFLGVFQIALAYVLLTSAIRRVTAFEASLLLLVEPVLSPVWAWGVHGEVPGRWAVVGGGLVLLATAFKTLLDLGRPGARRGVRELAGGP